jgi:hypothetical protein
MSTPIRPVSIPTRYPLDTSVSNSYSDSLSVHTLNANVIREHAREGENDPALIRAMIERELPANWRVQVAENASAHELADAWATNIGILHRAWWRAKDRREAIRFHERRLRELAG